LPKKHYNDAKKEGSLDIIRVNDILHNNIADIAKKVIIHI